MIKLNFEKSLAETGIQLGIAAINITFKPKKTEEYDLSAFFSPIVTEILSKYNLENIKLDPIISAYRTFYWKFLNIDPTKTRPASEALIRRILGNKQLPKISPFVDAYNWASVKSRISLGAYDASKIICPIVIRYSTNQDRFFPIGKDEQPLPEKCLVTSDSSGNILCQYPYRDSSLSKVSNDTSNIILLAYGVNSIQKEHLLNAINLTIDHLEWMQQNHIFSFQKSEIQYFENSC
jgi:DNA/RNA-binding domain of Phe-tRNA-synthetase-like protein